ncbi:MAG: cell division protein SepF, partial [Thermocrispum sp.]
DYDEPPARMPGRTRAARRVEDLDDLEVPVRGRVRGTPADIPVSAGALAIDRAPEPVARLRQVDPPPVTRDPLSRIVTLHPGNYAEARGIGEAFRAGNPVIMNLTEMDNADAKRLVDFAAGLAFALRGSMDKVTNKVFLLSPPDSDVSAEDRRRIAEGGLFLRR